jgi:hypothetical protein
MMSIWLSGNSGCRLPQDFSGPGFTVCATWLYRAALSVSNLIPLQAVTEIQTVLSVDLRVIQNNQQVRSPPGGAVCV